MLLPKIAPSPVFSDPMTRPATKLSRAATTGGRDGTTVRRGQTVRKRPRGLIGRPSSLFAEIPASRARQPATPMSALGAGAVFEQKRPAAAFAYTGHILGRSVNSNGYAGLVATLAIVWLIILPLAGILTPALYVIADGAMAVPPSLRLLLLKVTLARQNMHF
jgi:hypothetical protein